MKFSPAFDNLIEALRCLPGVGPKSAQRMALHLLERDRAGAARLRQAIDADHKRDASQLCIVETPGDILAIELAGGFRGRYFVLMGHLSPIDGIGPEDIGLSDLETLVRSEGPVEPVRCVQ